MKNWIGLIITFILFFGGGLATGVGWGRALTDKILVKNRAEHAQTYLTLKAEHADRIKDYERTIEKQQQRYAHLYNLFEQFKNHPFYPY